MTIQPSPPPLSTGKRIWFVTATAVCALIGIACAIMALVSVIVWFSDSDPAALWMALGGVVPAVLFIWAAVHCSGRLKTSAPEQIPCGCQVCGAQRPIMKVGLNRHIGAVVVMFHRTVSGYLCKPCISSVFWKYTLVTFFFGWWGLVSLVVTPVVLVNNLVMYIRSLFMPVGQLTAESGSIRSF